MCELQRPKRILSWLVDERQFSTILLNFKAISTYKAFSNVQSIRITYIQRGNWHPKKVKRWTKCIYNNFLDYHFVPLFGSILNISFLFVFSFLLLYFLFVLCVRPNGNGTRYQEENTWRQIKRWAKKIYIFIENWYMLRYWNGPEMNKSQIYLKYKRK